MMISLRKIYNFMLHDWQGKPLGIDIDGMYMSFLTMSTGIVTIEDGKTELLIDIRYPNDTNAERSWLGFNAT